LTRVLDTAVLVDVLRGDEAAVGFLAGLEEVPLCSEITRIEVLRGLRSAERRAGAALLSAIDWAPVDEDVAIRAGELGRAWRGSHPGIDTADLAIAATAELSGRLLATTNLKHYPMFDGLARPYG
jgi:predicted nucleic acid-binding protein